jgi:hypothetical protein
MLGLAQRTMAADEPKDIIAKALKAHGGADKLAKLQAMQIKTKGHLDLLGGFDFTQEMAVNLSGKLKDTMKMDIMGNAVTVITVYDGKQGWLNVNGMTMDMPEAVLEAMKEAVYMMGLTQSTLLNDKEVQLALVGEMKVNDKPAVGVKVSSKGHKDINLYYDKETGLLAKIEHRALDFQTMQEVAEERIITEYQEVDGLKTGKKVTINRDGKKFLDAEVTEVKFTGMLDDSEFAKP